ncbi:ABC transporter permease [Alteromonas stellipolaris]|uniref:ABC-2 type transporter transmembrane domain-containing protein n=1 Tax=Alteromonas stellipolaris TaxID=233316 RepID=A0ABN4LUU0_9ALTE|nr:hypothetical protein AVL57_00400 [Alteromonas stellipolaris]
MQKVISLAKFEFLEQLNLKADAISIAIIGAILAARFFTVEFFNATTPVHLAAVVGSYDEQVIDFDRWKDNETLYNIPLLNSEAEAKRMMEQQEIDGYLTFCFTCDARSMTLHSMQEFHSQAYIYDLSSHISEIALPALLNISDVDFELIKNGLAIDYDINNEVVSPSASMLNTIFMFLTVLGILSAFSLLLQAITAEKEEKITQMYISCMNVNEWVDAKVLASLGVSVKAFALYFVFTALILSMFGLLQLEGNDVTQFIMYKVPILILVFAVGFVFWSYLFALVSVLIRDQSSSIKNAAIMLPMAAFGIVVSLGDYIATLGYKALSFFPITFVFAMPNRIITTDVGYLEPMMASAFVLLAAYGVRHLTYRYLRFVD